MGHKGSLRRARTALFTSEGPRGRELRPSGRTLILVALGVVAGLAMVLTAVVSLRTPDAKANRLADHDLPARNALAASSRATVAQQAHFLSALESSDPIGRGLAINETRNAGQARDAAWATYLRVALLDPGERAVQQSFETAALRAQELATGLLATSPSDPAYAPNLASEKAAAEEGLAALDLLESRFYGARLETDATAVAVGIGATHTAIYFAYGALAAVFIGLGLALMRSARRDERLMAHETALLADVALRADFETSLQRGMEMQPTEEATFGVLRQAMDAVAPGIAGELLLADSTHGQFGQILSTRPDINIDCNVGTPAACPAATSGDSRFFDDSRRIDTCPFLRNREDAVWAVCVPMILAGETTGVIRAQGDFADSPPDNIANDLELIGRKAAERVSVIRVLAHIGKQAKSDAAAATPNGNTPAAVDAA
jgi:hypothetical protein